MANADTPMGFTPVGHKGGGVIRAQEFEIKEDYTTAIYSGAPVILSSGYVNVAAQDSATMSMTRATKSTRPTGPASIWQARQR